MSHHRVTLYTDWTEQGASYNDVTRGVYEGSLGETDLVTPYLENEFGDLLGSLTSWSLYELNPITNGEWP